jgi:hypothetical protein
MAKTSLILIVASLIPRLLPANDWPVVSTSISAGRLDTHVIDEVIFCPADHHEVATESLVILGDAYLDQTKPGFVLHAGKQWNVNSALLPVPTDIGSGYYGGSIASGRTYLRVQRDLSMSDALLVTLQGSLDQKILADLPADRGSHNGLSDWPQMQGLVAFTLCVAPRTTDQWTVQTTSAFHFLEASPPPFDLPPESDACFETSSLDVDLRVPFGKRAGLQAHCYTGINLSPFFGAMGDDILFRMPRPLHSTGGWCKAWYDWTAWCQSQVGIGVDDAVNYDSFLGRRYDHFVFANLSIDLSDRLTTGVEVIWREPPIYDGAVNQLCTDRPTLSQPVAAMAIDWMVTYGF